MRRSRSDATAGPKSGSNSSVGRARRRLRDDPRTSSQDPPRRPRRLRRRAASRGTAPRPDPTPARNASWAMSIRSTVCRHARQHDSKRLRIPDLSSPASCASALSSSVDEIEGAGPVAGHRQRVDLGGDRFDQPGMSGVEVVAAGAQARRREADRGAVREGRARVVRLDEGAVAADADRVGQRDTARRGRGSRGRARSRRPRETGCARSRCRSRECPVVAGEQHHEVVEVPEPVVDRRRRQQHDLLVRSAEQTLHRPVPGRVLVAERVRLVDEHEPVGVLVVAGGGGSGRRRGRAARRRPAR